MCIFFVCLAFYRGLLIHWRLSSKVVLIGSQISLSRSSLGFFVVNSWVPFFIGLSSLIFIPKHLIFFLQIFVAWSYILMYLQKSLLENNRLVDVLKWVPFLLFWFVLVNEELVVILQEFLLFCWADKKPILLWGTFDAEHWQIPGN